VNEFYIRKCEKFSHGCGAGSYQVANRMFVGLLLVLGSQGSPRQAALTHTGTEVRTVALNNRVVTNVLMSVMN